MTLRPSDCHADLTEERLAALADLLASTRFNAALLHEPQAGDDSWSLGCRSFARTRNLIAAKAQSGEWPWLRVINPGKRFIFAVGQVPIRFYRGLHSNPPDRTLAYSPIELSQLSLAFDEGSDSYRHLKWRFAIETDFMGMPTSIMFSALNGEDGSVAHSWVIPFTTSVPVDLVETNNDDVLDLPTPSVVVRTPAQAETETKGA